MVQVEVHKHAELDIAGLSPSLIQNFYLKLQNSNRKGYFAIILTSIINLNVEMRDAGLLIGKLVSYVLLNDLMTSGKVTLKVRE